VVNGPNIFQMLLVVYIDADAQAMMPPHLQLEFKCFLIDHKTNKHVPVRCPLLLLQVAVIHFVLLAILSLVNLFLELL